VTLKKSEKRLLIVLGVVVSVFLVDQFILSSEKEETAPPGAKPKEKGAQVLKTVASSSNTPGNAAGSGRSSMAEIRFSDWGGNPFSNGKPTAVARSLAKQAEKKEEIKKPELQGFFWKKGKAFVLVDNVILSEGEEKDGIRIDRIQEKEVLCSKSGQTFTLYWRESL
jgi:hypothetical protein